MEHQDWLQHKHTSELLKKYMRLRDAAYRDLVHTCARSIDPEVRGQAMQLSALDDTVSMLTGTQKGASEDE